MPYLLGFLQKLYAEIQVSIPVTKALAGRDKRAVAIARLGCINYYIAQDALLGGKPTFLESS